MLQSDKASQANAMQMSIMFHCDAWSWISIWVNVILFISEYGKIIFLPVFIMVNSTYYFVL